MINILGAIAGCHYSLSAEADELKQAVPSGARRGYPFNILLVVELKSNP